MSKPDLSPVLDQLRKLETKVEQFAANTYSRELMDEKLRNIDDQLKDIASDIKQTRDNQTTSSERTWTRIGVAVAVGYTLLQALPHLASAFASK